MQNQFGQTYHASTSPVEDIQKVTVPGQNPKMRMYRPGYEAYFNEMPVLMGDDPLLAARVSLSNFVMQKTAAHLIEDGWVPDTDPGVGGFSRNILAIESPKEMCGHLGTTYEEGAEMLVASWGEGFTSPVHGHAPGYMHEEILYGKMRVNTYRQMSPDSNIVRPVMTTIEERGTFASRYTPEDPDAVIRRRALIHNFTAVGFSASLHFLPEHTRDGRDNRFEAEHFEQYHKLTADDVTQITGQQAMYSRIGTVILVRSTNVPEYADHYIVITGAPVQKEHGLRPQDTAIQAPLSADLLDSYEPTHGVTLLQLHPEAQSAFLDFHAIKLVDGAVVFPEA